MTYVWTAEGWAYVAAILDLFSRSVVGWALGSTLETTLVERALDMALTHRCPADGLLLVPTAAASTRASATARSLPKTKSRSA